MEAANLPTFQKFGNAKKSDFVLSLQKNRRWPRNWGAWSKTGGVSCAPWPGPKTANGSVTFHMGSYSVSCHLTHLNTRYTPRLNPSRIGRYSIYNLPRGIEG